MQQLKSIVLIKFHATFRLEPVKIKFTINRVRKDYHRWQYGYAIGTTYYIQEAFMNIC